MTEDEASDRLADFLRTIDAEAKLLAPGHVTLACVIDADQTAPRPGEAYATITPLGERDGGKVDGISYRDVVIEGVSRVVERRTRGVELGYRVDVYASRPSDYTKLFLPALRSSRAQLDFLPAKVRRITEPVAGERSLVQGHWEGRAHFTVTLGTHATSEVLVDVIEHVTVGLTGIGGATNQRSLTVSKP